MMFSLYRCARPIVKLRATSALTGFRECSTSNTSTTGTDDARVATDGSVVSHSSQTLIDRGDIFKRYPPLAGGVVRRAWVETLDAAEPKTGATVRLHPEVWSVKPRLDIIKDNLDWQLRYKFMSYEHVKHRKEMPDPPRPGRPWPKKGTGRARHSSWRYVHEVDKYFYFKDVQRPAKVLVRGLMKFVPAVACHTCLNVPVTFSQPRTKT